MVETIRDNDDEDAHQASLCCLLSSHSAVTVVHLHVWSAKIPVFDGFDLFDGFQESNTGRVRWCRVSVASFICDRSHAFHGIP